MPLFGKSSHFLWPINAHAQYLDWTYKNTANHFFPPSLNSSILNFYRNRVISGIVLIEDLLTMHMQHSYSGAAEQYNFRWGSSSERVYEGRKFQKITLVSLWNLVRQMPHLPHLFRDPWLFLLKFKFTNCIP